MKSPSAPRSVLKAIIFPDIHPNVPRVPTENLALRQQLAILQRTARRPKLRQRERVFWVWLSKLWRHWRSALLVVKTDTVVRWHREGFRLYWRWTSRRGGRPTMEKGIRQLIRQMSQDNPTWGTPRIQSELALLGHNVAESTAAKYMVRRRKPPFQTWRILRSDMVDSRRHCSWMPPETEIRYCRIMTQVVAWETLMGKAVAVHDGSTERVHTRPFE